MITANIVQWSKSSTTGKEIITFELEYPRYIHCFDDETELLVKELDKKPIFKQFKDVIYNENYEVAQVDTAADNFEITYVKPLAWHEQSYYNESMVELQNHQRLNFKVTKKHRMFVGSRKSKEDKKEFILAEELLSNHTQKRFYKSGILTNQKDLGNDLCKLVAYFVSDGSLSRSKYPCFHFKKQRKIDEVKKLLTNLKYEFKESNYLDGSTNIWFKMLDWMQECYNSEGKKCLPKFIFDMNQENFIHFKQGLLESDGCVANNEYNNSSTELINDLSVVFHTHGESFNIKKYGDLYKVKFLTEDKPVLRTDKHTVIETKYTGKVYCVTVPTGAILVRRKGIVHISGNCELLTHRVFSRNSASSRAIPVNTVLKNTFKNPAKPVHWGKNQKGMQAKEELKGIRKLLAKTIWNTNRYFNLLFSYLLLKVGLHKQLSNRRTEPDQNIKVLVTTTELNNWFWLRDHPDAQPEIRQLAEAMSFAMKDMRNIRNKLTINPGEWHLPYIDRKKDERDYLRYYSNGKEVDLDTARRVSASGCAQISYRLLDTSLSKSEKIFKQLIESEPCHASPVEHQATPVLETYKGIQRDPLGASYAVTTNLPEDSKTWQEGITHVDRDGNFWSGNFCNFIQYRQLINNNVKKG